jgi:hypothetical protein
MTFMPGLFGQNPTIGSGCFNAPSHWNARPFGTAVLASADEVIGQSHERWRDTG